ncbi:hypothetical protein MRY87_01780 [bacterium]|nr:hypothetical protein [bacterium]
MKRFTAGIFAVLFLTSCSPAMGEGSPDELPSEERMIDSYEACVAAGHPIFRSYPPKCSPGDGRIFVSGEEQAIEVPLAVEAQGDSGDEAICRDQCGNGVCEQIVCQGTGCPCSESPDECPEDCTPKLF